MALTDLAAVLRGNKNLTAAERATAAALKNRSKEMSAEIQDAVQRAWALPSARPGHRGDTIANAFLKNRELTTELSGRYFSEQRLSTSEGIAELSVWRGLSGDAVRNEGSRQRAALSRLLAGDVDATSGAPYKGIAQRFPDPNHPARRMYAAIGQLDSQAAFVLVSGGFFDRLRDLLRDDERGVLRTDTLESAFDFDAEGSIQWDALIQEAKNARQYSVRNMGKL